jgi:hypothetical protein
VLDTIFPECQNQYRKWQGIWSMSVVAENFRREFAVTVMISSSKLSTMAFTWSLFFLKFSHSGSALDLNGRNHILFANRSFCHIKMENYGRFAPRAVLTMLHSSPHQR